MNKGRMALGGWFGIPLFFLVWLASAPAIAGEPGVKQSFARLNRCVRQNDSQGCRNLVTASSAALYNRFVSYGIMGCLPKDAVYISQKPVGNDIQVRVGATVAGEKRTLRLIFAYEEADWKLDIPASLHAGLGDNWESQLQVIENIYLFMHQQMGAQLNCAMIQDLGTVNAH